MFSETVHTFGDVEFEMSSILYNIGALHSELGATDNRQSAEGMKVRGLIVITFYYAIWICTQRHAVFVSFRMRVHISNVQLGHFNICGITIRTSSLRTFRRIH